MWKGMNSESTRCGHLATLLAASGDPRAAVVLGAAFDAAFGNTPEFPGGIRVLEGIHIYFLNDPRYRQLPPGEMEVSTNLYPAMTRQVKQWWTLNKEAVKASAKAQSK
jgi:hypothetical protein